MESFSSGQLYCPSSCCPRPGGLPSGPSKRTGKVSVLDRSSRYSLLAFLELAARPTGAFRAACSFSTASISRPSSLLSAHATLFEASSGTAPGGNAALLGACLALLFGLSFEYVTRLSREEARAPGEG